MGNELKKNKIMRKAVSMFTKYSKCYPLISLKFT